MKHEAAGEDYTKDEFFKTGLIIVQEERRQQRNIQARAEAAARVTEHEREAARDISLAKGKVLREHLKALLFADKGIVVD
jgi:hypothetical protein